MPYLSQAVTGHFRIMGSRVPIEEELKKTPEDHDNQRKLKLVLDVRSFASAELGLPKNKSYTTYSEIDGEYLGWNVYATPRFSMEPKKWCFPVAGCVVYRGYFSKEEALRFAEDLAKENHDVFVAPFTAYSTLGWYDDPVLTPHLRMSPIRLAGLIIHELAHQECYFPGDSRFNEAFAVAVERAGVLQWLKSKKRDDLADEALRLWNEEEAVVERMARARNELTALYSSGLDQNYLQEKKTTIFQALKKDLHGIRFAGIALPKTNGQGLELNNASLVPLDTYYSYVPVFQSMLSEAGGNFPQFYKRARELGSLPIQERNKEIDSLQERLQTMRMAPTQETK